MFHGDDAMPKCQTGRSSTPPGSAGARSLPRASVVGRVLCPIPECGSTPERSPNAISPLGRNASVIALFLVALTFLLPDHVEAIDGAVSVTDSRQSARRNAQAIETFSRRDVLRINQALSLGPGLRFDAGFRRQREVSGTAASGTRIETERTTLRPSVGLNYRRPGLRIGATGDWLDQRVTADSGPVPDQTRLQLGASLKADPTQSTRLSAVWRRTVTEQVGGLIENRESREHSGRFDLDQRLFRSWSLRYDFSTRWSDIVEQDTRRLAQSHIVEISGSPTLGDGRLRTTWRARSRFLHEKVETGTEGESETLLVPISASLTLDDTPEILDPLEDDPLPVPNLFDGNFDDPSSPIDIGDLARPRVRRGLPQHCHRFWGIPGDRRRPALCGRAASPSGAVWMADLPHGRPGRT